MNYHEFLQYADAWVVQWIAVWNRKIRRIEFEFQTVLLHSLTRNYTWKRYIIISRKICLFHIHSQKIYIYSYTPKYVSDLNTPLPGFRPYGLVRAVPYGCLICNTIYIRLNELRKLYKSHISEERARKFWREKKSGEEEFFFYF